MTSRIALLLVVLLCCRLGAAEDLLPGRGSEIFRFLLHQKGVKPAVASDDLMQPDWERKTILIIYNPIAFNRGHDEYTAEVIRNVVESGGSVLYLQAGDFNDQDKWFRFWGLRKQSGMNVPANELFDREFRAIPMIPFPGLPQLPPDSPHRVFKDLPQPVVVRDPDYISFGRQARMPGMNAIEVASWPEGTSYFHKVNRPLSTIAFRYPASGGQLMVISSPTVISNEMMTLKGKIIRDADGTERFESATGNLVFCQQLIDWLKGPDGSRTKCLFIEQGMPIEQFAHEVIVPPNMTPPPILPDIPPNEIANLLLQNASPIISELQEQDAFNQILLSIISLPTLIRLFLILCILVLIVAVLRTAANRRTATKPGATSADAYDRHENELPKGRILRQRNVGQFQVDNLYESARRRVRDRMIPLGAEPDAEGHMPAVLLAEDCRQPQILIRQIQRLWQIGFGNETIAIRIEAWDSFNKDLESILNEASRGGWTFASNLN